MYQKSNFKKFLSRLKVLLVLIVTGCAAVQEPLLPIDLADIHSTILIEQQLQIKTSARPIVMDSVLVVSPEKIDLIGSWLGINIFHFVYDGQHLSIVDDHKLPFNLSRHTIFNDAMYVFAPAASLLKALPQQAIYTQTNNARKIVLPSGEVVDIIYKKDSEDAGQAILSKSKSAYIVLFKYVINHDHDLSQCIGPGLCTW